MHYSAVRRSLLLVVACCVSAPTEAADDAKLDLAKDTPAQAEAETLQPATKENVIVYREPGRYGGWPANHGLGE